jgi:hypothetical protein
MWCSEKKNKLDSHSTLEVAERNLRLCQIWQWNWWYVWTFLVVHWPHTFPQVPRNPGRRKICLDGVRKDKLPSRLPWPSFLYEIWQTAAVCPKLSYREWRRLWNNTARCCSDFFDHVLGYLTDSCVSSSALYVARMVLRSLIDNWQQTPVDRLAVAADEGHKYELRTAEVITFGWSEAPRRVAFCLMPPVAVHITCILWNNFTIFLMLRNATSVQLIITHAVLVTARIKKWAGIQRFEQLSLLYLGAFVRF